MFKWLLIVLLVIFDQITKFVAVSNLKPIGSCNFINNILNFTYVENTGVAFGMFKDMHYLIVPFTVIITAGCIYLMIKSGKEGFAKLSFVFATIISGAVGNIIDKITRGFVVDFIEFDFVDFPVFNVADIYVTLGAVFFAILIIFTKDGDFFADKK